MYVFFLTLSVFHDMNSEKNVYFFFWKCQYCLMWLLKNSVFGSNCPKVSMLFVMNSEESALFASNFLLFFYYRQPTFFAAFDLCFVRFFPDGQHFYMASFD